jgi:hypothetical protein
LVIRDPRSVLASFKRFTYTPPPAYLGAIFNCLDAFQAAGRYARILPPERFKLVRYEDAVMDPSRTRGELFKFLGLDPALATSDINVQTNSAFVTSGAAFDTAAAVARWQSHLTREEIALTELICGTEMSRLGYQTSKINADQSNLLKLLQADPAMTAWFHDAVTHNRGVQAFPTDPLDPKNWEERQGTDF